MGFRIKESQELKTMNLEEMELYRAIQKSGNLSEKLQELCERYPKAEILLEYYPLWRFESVYLDVRIISCVPSYIQKEYQELYDRYYYPVLLHPLGKNGTTGKEI